MVAVGINYVGTPHRLHGCVTDVLAMRDLCQENFGRPEVHGAVIASRVFLTDPIMDVAVVTKTVAPPSDDPDDDDDDNEEAAAAAAPEVTTSTSLIRSQRPNRANMMAAYRQLAEEWRDDGTTHGYIQYSGHGTWNRDSAERDEPDGRDELLCPLDGYISDDELYTQLFKPLRQKGGTLVVLMDCCHSATTLDMRYNWQVRRLGDNSYTLVSYLGSVRGATASRAAPPRPRRTRSLFCGWGRQASSSGATSSSSGGGGAGASSVSFITPSESDPLRVIYFGASNDSDVASDVTAGGVSFGALTKSLTEVARRKGPAVTNLAAFLIEAQRLCDRYSKQRIQLASNHRFDPWKVPVPYPFAVLE